MRRSAGHASTFQFNPKELTITKSAKWERKPAKRGEEGRAAGVHRRGPVQAHAGDVLRRHATSTTAASSRRSRSCSRAASPPTPASDKKAAPPLVVFQLGDGDRLPGVRHLGQRQVHAVHLQRHPDPGDVQRLAGGDARRPAAGRTRPPGRRRPPQPPRGRRRQPRVPGVPRVRRRGEVAPARRGQRHRRPAAAPAGTTPAPAGARRAARAEPCPSATTSWSRSTAPLPADVEPLLPSVRRRQPQLPDLFVLRFRDPDHVVLPKAGCQDRRRSASRSAAAASLPGPLLIGEVTALEAEFDRAGHVHRRPGLRPRAPAVPRPPDASVHPDDRVRRRQQGRRSGPTCAPARSTPPARSSTTCRRRGHRLGVPRAARPRVRVRGRGARRQARLRPARTAREAPHGRGPARTRSCSPGNRPAALPADVTAAEQVKEVRGARLGRRPEAGAGRDGAGRDHQRRAADG